MKISELTAALSRVQQIVGDAEIVLKDVGTEAETVITRLGLDLGVDGTATEGTLTLSHDVAADAPPKKPQPAGDSTAGAEAATS